MNKSFDFPADGNYFLITGMPTPNGRIHLGHIAGPYLRMDVLKRKVQRNNGKAYLCSGSDVYESYVELKANQLHQSPEDVANYFHELIIKDFKALDIEFDIFTNPLTDGNLQEFKQRQQTLIKEWISGGHVVEFDEMIPYDPISGRYLTGCWIQGACPNCNKKTGSYLCENCGFHYKPQDILNFKDYPGVIMQSAKCLYLKLDIQAVMENAKKIQNAKFVQLLESYIRSQGPYIRLTTMQQTGIPFIWDSVKGQVVFTYTGLLLFSIICGDILQNTYGLEQNPMAATSGFICCASFGIDNVIPFLAGIHAGGLLLPGYRPFDYYFCNYFYYLNGQKFSTSKSHVIWAADIIELSNIQPDAVRYFLCKINPELQTENFDTYHFVRTINEDLCEGINNAVRYAMGYLTGGEIYEINERLFPDIENIVFKQEQSAVPEDFSLTLFLEPITEWIDYFDTATEKDSQFCYWWLKTLAYLCYPIMPRFAQSVWSQLTGNFIVARTDYYESKVVISAETEKIAFHIIEYTQVEKSLPKIQN
ncbi:MAG: hypothetical protein DI539_25565 [Flavobacterium psychrophilum]|nr:MAG: hypothetical protein DI539_25565 [Flavobacterium psychrophilum]